MTRYMELYHKQLAAVSKLQRELEYATEYRDRYLRFIQETGHQVEFMTWYAKDLGLAEEFIDLMPVEPPPLRT